MSTEFELNFFVGTCNKKLFLQNLGEQTYTYIIYYTVALAKRANASVCWRRGNCWGGGVSRIAVFLLAIKVVLYMYMNNLKLLFQKTM